MQYEWGIVVDQSYQDAAAWYAKSAKLGNTEALKALEKAADQGHADAQYKLGVMFYKDAELNKIIHKL